MAKAEVEIQGMVEFRAALLAKVTKSTLYVSKLKQWADRKADKAAAVATLHYEGAIAEIGELLDDGVAGGAVARSSLNISTPSNGRVAVQVKWAALNAGWLAEKNSRSRGGKGGRGKRGGKGRGKSIGAGRFWLDEGKLSRAFRTGIRGKGTVSVVPVLREKRGGDFEITFEFRFEKLPARYLDRAIRRSLLRGATGLGGGLGLIDIPDSELTTAGKPRGLARGGWPEMMRPLMRPIAQRLGRAMQQQILKSLRRR